MLSHSLLTLNCVHIHCQLLNNLLCSFHIKHMVIREQWKRKSVCHTSIVHACIACTRKRTYIQTYVHTRSEKFTLISLYIFPSSSFSRGDMWVWNVWAAKHYSTFHDETLLSMGFRIQLYILNFILSRLRKKMKMKKKKKVENREKLPLE